MRYLVTFIVDVEAANPDQATSQALAVVSSGGRIDGYDVEVEPFHEHETQESKHADAGYMNDVRFGDSQDE